MQKAVVVRRTIGKITFFDLGVTIKSCINETRKPIAMKNDKIKKIVKLSEKKSFIKKYSPSTKFSYPKLYCWTLHINNRLLYCGERKSARDSRKKIKIQQGSTGWRQKAARTWTFARFSFDKTQNYKKINSFGKLTLYPSNDSYQLELHRIMPQPDRIKWKLNTCKYSKNCGRAKLVVGRLTMKLPFPAHNRRFSF